MKPKAKELKKEIIKSLGGDKVIDSEYLDKIVEDTILLTIEKILTEVESMNNPRLIKMALTGRLKKEDVDLRLKYL